MTPKYKMDTTIPIESIRMGNSICVQRANLYVLSVLFVGYMLTVRTQIRRRRTRRLIMVSIVSSHNLLKFGLKRKISPATLNMEITGAIEKSAKNPFVYKGLKGDFTHIR